MDIETKVRRLRLLTFICIPMSFFGGMAVEWQRNFYAEKGEKLRNQTKLIECVNDMGQDHMDFCYKTTCGFGLNCEF